MIGTDKKGVMFYLMYGSKYPTDKEMKGTLKIDLFNITDYITTTYITFSYN